MASSYSIQLPNIFSIDKPQLEGAYSVDGDRKYANNWDSLRYLKIPKQINFNLNDGDYVDKPPYKSTERMDQMTSFVMFNKQTLIKDHRVNTDFLCFRGIFKIIMATPYMRKSPWTMHAIKFKGTIYMCMISEQQEEKPIRKTTKFEQYGFKFESHVLSNDLQSMPPGSKSTVIEAEEFCVVMSTRINNKFKVIFGAGIDGVESIEIVNDIEKLKKSSLVEVKLMREEGNDKQKENFIKFRAFQWWCQSFVANVDEIHCGIRDDSGIVHQVKTYKIEALVQEAEKNKFWCRSTCKKFLSNFLEQIFRDMRFIDDPMLVYRYNWNPYRNQIDLEKRFGQTFLSSTYIEFVENL